MKICGKNLFSVNVENDVLGFTKGVENMGGGGGGGLSQYMGGAWGGLKCCQKYL